MSSREPDQEIARIQTRFGWLDVERTELNDKLARLERQRTSIAGLEGPICSANAPTVTAASPISDKVALFRGLFVGRSDVFPVRWENPKTGRSGYAPAYANEWVKGVCRKPQVKCGECPNQAFVAVSDEIIEKHL